MTKVKICGITSVTDALVCLDLGADALGFVFYAQSRRYIAPGSARLICLALPERVEKIGVFVNEAPEQVLNTALYAGLSAVQLHGEESMKECALLSARIPVIKSVPVSRAEDVDKAFDYKGVTILFDSKCKEYGGCGRTFPWEYLKNYRKEKGAFVLSGGLTPDNVSEAVSLLKPDMVDVSSGVESQAGKKDPDKVKAFINIVKRIK